MFHHSIFPLSIWFKIVVYICNCIFIQVVLLRILSYIFLKNFSFNWIDAPENSQNHHYTTFYFSIFSMRWKMLLGFSCRNRLLLSGTPIQNSMAELWALLHFIMPSMFDSHNEFNEWFSKDIESHAENKTSIDES